MIQIRNLTHVYRTIDGSSLTALDNVNLDIHDGEFVTVVGKSGCGKSTLLKSIVGLISPKNGTVCINGEFVNYSKPNIGIVFQNATLLPWRTVLNNILLPIEVIQKRRKDYLTTAHELLDMVGLNEYANRLPQELSGGMQQRVAICRALILDPKLLLMDEPFGALDALTREELGMELMQICTERKKTVVFVTHSIPEAILLADRVVVMMSHPGRIARTIDINIPKPRELEIQFTEAFQHYYHQIRDLIFQK